ncbi:LpqB family beta-propeller domain-containing protein [Nocardioides sp. LS1]|uniref:LpqB family beta-propeller domain-containing protein n=1 Tax=Nocardioides sp. LS1 TaxID=1027620 RepID=UPI000F627441|nr:LpqB family beta-propeller domain-containing protein [Nocardioides sp. LS1]GCD91639.1 lipoprotein LpqB [Nocardioides sp. LS1]
MRRRRLATAVLMGLVLALPTGCIRVPESGPVVKTRSQVGSSPAEPPIYIDPKPPQPGALPVDIVNGFLDAMTATPISTDVAKEFLSPDAASTWAPEKETITYSDNPEVRGQATVSVTLPGADHLDGRGSWRGALGDDQNILEFPMQQVDGEWRIAEAPDALVVPESWYEQRYRQASLYFFDPTAHVLVPEPVYVPRGEKLATALIQGLLRGPGRSLSKVSRTFIPPGLKLVLSVPAQSVADISLRGDIGQQTPQAIELMVAQLAWTLRQEPTIRAFRISIGGQPVTLPGGVGAFSVDQGSQYDPTGFQASSLLYGLREGRLVSGTPDGLDTVDGPLGAADFGVSQIGVNFNATRVAAVAGGGHSLLLAPVRGPAGLGVHEIVSGARHLLRPAWDFANRLWLVDDAADGARVSFVEGQQPTGVQVPHISGQDVRSFLVSRDGSRFVAVVHRRSGDALMISRLLYDDQGRFLRATRAHRIAWEGPDRLHLGDIAWQTPTTVAALDVLTQRLAQVRTISVDGSPPGLESLSFTLDGKVRSLAGSAVPGAPLYAVFNASLYDLTNAVGGPTSLDASVSALDYVG